MGRPPDADLQMEIIELLSWHSLSSVLVNDLNADGGATLGLQVVPGQVLGGEVADAAAVGGLAAQVTPGIQAAQAPATKHSFMTTLLS